MGIADSCFKKKKKNPTKLFPSPLSTESPVMTWSYSLKKDCHREGQCDIYFRKMKQEIPIPVISCNLFYHTDHFWWCHLHQEQEFFWRMKVRKDWFPGGFIFRFHPFAEEWPHNDMFLESTIDLSQSWVIWRKVPLCNCWEWENLDWLQDGTTENCSVPGSVWHVSSSWIFILLVGAPSHK